MRSLRASVSSFSSATRFSSTTCRMAARAAPSSLTSMTFLRVRRLRTASAIRSATCSRLGIAGIAYRRPRNESRNGGDEERYARAVAGFTFEIDGPAVSVDERLHDREAETRAAGGADAGGSVIGLEDVRQGVRGDAAAGVVHREFHTGAVPGPRGDAHGAAGGRVFHRVRDQVLEDPIERVRVGVHAGQAVFAVGHEIMGAGAPEHLDDGDDGSRGFDARAREPGLEAA